MKPIFWHGSSYKDIRAFPASARREAGFQLDKIQRGLEPDDWKPMKTVGPGVREIRIRESVDQYRVMYVATSGDYLHVLHAFKKKTQKTSQQDLQLAKIRFNEIRDKK